MAEYKDAFVERDTLKIDFDGVFVAFRVTQDGQEKLFVADGHTFKDIVRELNTLTWSVHG